MRWKIVSRRISEESLRHDLVASRVLEPGDLVMVHSSLSRVGNVTGGPETVCRVLQSVLTDQGTLLMPSYHQPEPILSMIHRGVVVDLRTAQSHMGSITETFRNLPGVKRSSHPFSSVCAWGRYAHEVTANHSSSPYICGPRSPFHELLNRSGRYMGIGVDIRVIALYHVLEENWSEFPVKVHVPRRFPIQYVDASGRVIERDLVILDPEVARTRIDQQVKGAWIRQWLTHYMREQGVLQEFKFGQARSWVVDARLFYERLRELALQGITIYTTKREVKAYGDRSPLRGDPK